MSSISFTSILFSIILLCSYYMNRTLGCLLDFRPHPESLLSLKDIVWRNGYPFEEHTTVTQDGYILGMQRIPWGANSLPRMTKKPVVFLMHGLFSNSETYTLAGPGSGLAYIMADLGYDVWLGNARGTQYSRRHVVYNPDQDSNFWKYSFHELGVYDLPAMIDYALDQTHQSNLTYVGHSQGTTAFFAMASERPEYNGKINLMVALSPVAFLYHLKQPLIRALSSWIDIISFIGKVFNYERLIPYKTVLWTLSRTLCSEKILLGNLCAKIIFYILGTNWEQLDFPLISVLVSRMPDDASFKQLIHYGQLIKTGQFKTYDYGSDINMRRYGTLTPPRYNLQKITAPIALVYGKNDLLVSEVDVDLLATQLPNVVMKYLIPFPKFTHIDFLISRNLHQLLYSVLLPVINTFSPAWNQQ